MIKRSLSSFVFILFISLFIYVFIYLFVGKGGGCSDILYIFEWGSPPSPHPQQKSTIFIKMGETPPVCREHVYTGTPRTKIGKSIFNKSNVMSFSTKKKT